MHIMCHFLCMFGFRGNSSSFSEAPLKDKKCFSNNGFFASVSGEDFNRLTQNPAVVWVTLLISGAYYRHTLEAAVKCGLHGAKRLHHKSPCLFVRI